MFGFPDQMGTHEKAETCFDNHPFEFENVVEEVGATIDFEQGWLMK